MSKPKPIQISIPNPCHKPWNEMTPSGNGRHCAHCDKVVTDFTKFTDKQLFEHFSQHINRHSCGRFTALQVNRPIQPPPQPNSKLYRLFIGLGLTLLLTQIPTQDASSKTPFVSCYDKFIVNENEQEVTGDDSVRISGTIVDEKGEPLPDAIVSIERDKKILGGTATDTAGKFSIVLNDVIEDNDDLTLKIQASGYVTSLITKHNKNSIQQPIDIRMKLNELIEFEVIYSGRIRMINPYNPGTNTTIKSEQIEKMPH